METVNSLTSAASRAVFGTNTNENTSAGQEPVSGQLGDVKKGEPYDKGNLETTTEAGTEGEIEGQEPVAGKKGDVRKGEPFDLGNADPQPTTTSNENDTNQKDKDTASTSAETTESTPEAFKGPGPHAHEIKAGDSTGISTNNKLDTEDGKHSSTEEKGVGEQYVKISGVKAGGGEFDAGKPGAGKEADRILAEEGIAHESGRTATTGAVGGGAIDTHDTNPAPKKEKVSLKDKIKAKLHKHKD